MRIASAIKIDGELLTERVNARLGRKRPYHRNWIYAVRAGLRESPALREIIRDEERRILEEHFAALQPGSSKGKDPAGAGSFEFAFPSGRKVGDEE